VAAETEASQTAEAPPLERRTMTVLVASVVLLVVFEYWGLPSRFEGTALHDRVADLLGDGYRPYYGLLPYQYWALSSLLIRVLAPLAIIVWVLRESPRDWGFRLTGQWRHIRPYVLFLAAMLPVLAWASTLGSFQAKYPFYDDAAMGGWHFWGYQLAYGLQFLGVEAFFRGFMVFGLERRLGWYAIPVMVIPYTMIHFGKPAPEAFAAIVAGFLLGWMALRSRSFVWGAALHWSVAITMDVLVIGRDIGFGPMIEAVF
jgi:membrane protease YdiL (CAAX protease family)